jgi:hypothetical protein
MRFKLMYIINTLRLALVLVGRRTVWTVISQNFIIILSYTSNYLDYMSFIIIIEECIINLL